MASLLESSSSTTGQKGIFPFLSLPAELRLKVYTYVCDHRFMSVPPRGRTASIANFSNAFHLARINRQIRNESLPHVFSDSILIIEWETLHRYVYANLPELAAQSVTTVRIVSFPVNGLATPNHTYDKFYPWSLATFFPSLRSLRIVLKSDECISKSISGRMPWYWGHDEFTASEVLKVPGMNWIRRNKGIRKLTFKAYNLCWLCSKLDGVEAVLEEVSRQIKEDVERS